MRVLLQSVSFLVCLWGVQGALYPYGVDEGDTAYRTDQEFVIGETRLFGKTIFSMKAKINGQLHNSRFRFRLWGANERKSIALLANDIGTMYYRRTIDTPSKSRALDEITSAFGLSYASFRVNYVMVLTYANVTYFGGDNTTPVNTLQMAFITDLSRAYSFIQYNFDDLNWFGNETTDINFPTIDVKVKEGQRQVFYRLPGSKTSDVISSIQRGNTGVPNQWMFRVDMCPTCLSLPHGFCKADGLTDQGKCQCNTNYRGELCELYIPDIDECMSSPCVHGNCTDGLDSYSCTCDPGFTGVNCEQEIDECATADLCINGNCTDAVNSFECDCLEGFSGVQCEVDINECISNPCVNGTCQDLVAGYRCSCFPGFVGDHCGINVDECGSSPCMNGTCIDGVNRYDCECMPGFSGALCDMDIDDCVDNHCINGVCNDAVAGFNCVCNMGFTGSRCEVNINDCNTESCNNGTCLDGNNNFHCECFPGFTGVRCEQDLDECLSGPCGFGICEDRENGYECLCASGYTGTHCDKQIDDCKSQPCVVGECMDGISSFSCKCTEGYTGLACDVEINECDSSPCVNGACHDVLAGFVCACSTGYEGVTCESETDECRDVLCHHGNCTDGVGGFSCNCDEGYTGTFCEIDKDDCKVSPCVHGSCTDGIDSFTCSCFPGYTGNRCENELNECENGNLCQQGTCIDEINRYSCRCFPGYVGELCDTNTDECESDPCLQGDCVDCINGYTCNCSSGYQGMNCEQSLPMTCTTDPCVNGACKIQSKGFVCQCFEGYNGTFCEIDERPSTGSFGDWGEWGFCSKACDAGLQRRFRQCLRSPCEDENMETRLCNTQSCAENEIETRNGVVLMTTKSVYEVVSMGERLRQTVASMLTRYCAANPGKCCEDINSENLAFRGTISKEEVFVARGSPRPADVTTTYIRLFIRLDREFYEKACDVTRSRQRRHVDDVSASVYLHQELIEDAIIQNLNDINNNQAVCCYTLLSRDISAQAPPEFFTGTILATSLSLLVAATALLVYIVYMKHKRNSRFRRKQSTEQRQALRYSPYYLFGKNISKPLAF